eukprot:996149-Rhodomonas_salina.1
MAGRRRVGVSAQVCGRPYAIGLRACYAMPGTDKAYGVIGLRACYAMSGIHISVCCSAMLGTAIAYALLPAYPLATRYRY